MLWAIFVKPFNHVIVFTSFHAVSHYLPPLSLSFEFCGQIFENIFFFLDLLVQQIFFHKNHWSQLFSTKNNSIISLSLISITLHSLSASHSIIPSVCKKKKKGKKKKSKLSMKTILLPSLNHLTQENFVSRFALCLSFVFFVFGFWPVDTTTADSQGLTHSNPCKMY